MGKVYRIPPVHGLVFLQVQHTSDEIFYTERPSMQILEGGEGCVEDRKKEAAMLV